jgi:hypothetical protein
VETRCILECKKREIYVILLLLGRKGMGIGLPVDVIRLLKSYLG